jgi:hypothetical protein
MLKRFFVCILFHYCRDYLLSPIFILPFFLNNTTIYFHLVTQLPSLPCN